MQGLANSVPTDSHGGTVAGVRQVAPPSAISTASAFPPVHAGATHYQPYPEVSLQALGAAPSAFVSTQPDVQSSVPFQPTASSTVMPSLQQPYIQQQMQQQQYGQLHQQQVQLQQQSQQLPTPQTQQAQQRPPGLPATTHMNGHMQARPQQQVRPPYPGQPGGCTQLRPGPGVSRPPSVAAAAAAAQQQMRPHALAPVTPRRVSPMPFKLIAPNSAVRTIPATVQARLSVGSIAPRGPVPAPGAPPRPQLVMGVPAGGRGALQMATGTPVPSAGAPGTAAPGRPMMRPASQPQVTVSTAADMSMQGQSHPAFQAKPTSTTPPPVVGPETPQIFPGVPLAAAAAQPPSPQPQSQSATPQAPLPQPQSTPLSPPQPLPFQPPSVQVPQAPVHTAAPVVAQPPKQPTALESAQSVAPQPGPPAVSSEAAEPRQSNSPPEQEQDEVMDFLNDEEELDVVGSPVGNSVKEEPAEKAAEQEAADPPKPTSSASASMQAGGSRAFMPPAQSDKSAEPEADEAADGATVTDSAAPSVTAAKSTTAAKSVTAAKSSSGEATGDRSGGKGTVTGSDGGSGAVAAPGPAPLIIRDWGSVGGGFVPFGASVQKTAPKGGKVLPQGSVKAKPSAAIGAALGPHLVLPNGNVSGPRACAPVEAFELPGSIAKGAAVPPAPPSVVAATAFDYHPGLASTPLPSPGTALPLRPAGPAASSPGRAASVKPPIVPKPKAKPRPLFDGEERKRGPAGRTSMYKGVTKHRRSGRWEAHVWVREDGKQAYLGGYSTEEEAAEAHDVAALKCHGLKAKTNFHISRYTALLDRLDSVPMNELVMAIRRTSPGFTRGSSSFRGVTQHKSGRWEVRIGLRGSKHVYLGLHSSEVEAARVYDRALVLLTGSSAATNFPVSNYTKELEAYQKRIDNGEQLPGFHNDGEYSEHAFEAWLRDAAIMPAPVPGINNTRIVDSNTGASPADAEAAQAQAVEEPKPKPTKPKRRRIATAALGGGVIDEGSEATPRAPLANNGSPRPVVKRRRTSHIGRPNKQSQHVHDGMLDLSQVGKPKQGRPGPRRKAEAAESDTAAILMQMATVAEGLGRAHPSKRSRLPTWGRGPALLLDEEMEEEDVEISDDDEPMPLLTTRKRRGTNARSSRLGNPVANGKPAAEKAPPSITEHRFTSPAALLEAIDDTETSKSQILQALSSMDTKARKPGASEAAAQQNSLAVPDFVMWLGLVSAVGRLAHGMLDVISSAPANA